MRLLHKNIIAISILIAIICMAVALSNDKRGVAAGTSSKAHRKVIHYLAGKVTMEKPVADPLSRLLLNNVTTIYVLGGNQNNLIQRYRTASILYHQGLSKKILILDRPGITEFSPELGRNLTNNEWSIRELDKLKVRREDIETVSVRAGFFGTLNEAKGVSDTVRRKGCDRLILVTSDYHTRRTFDAFLTYLPKDSHELYIYGSGGTSGIVTLLAEYAKLLFYDYMVLPILGHSRILRNSPLSYC
jgi:uncharacterized SAM-binding protein YcdF (DUF218 family)